MNKQHKTQYSNKKLYQSLYCIVSYTVSKLALMDERIMKGSSLLQETTMTRQINSNEMKRIIIGNINSELTKNTIMLGKLTAKIC